MVAKSINRASETLGPDDFLTQIPTKRLETPSGAVNGFRNHQYVSGLGAACKAGIPRGPEPQSEGLREATLAK